MQVYHEPAEDQAVREPVTVQELRLALHLSAADKTDDAVLASCITRARAAAETAVNYAVVRQQYVTVARDPESEIIPLMPEVRAVASVTVGTDGTETELTSSQYDFRPDCLILSAEVMDTAPDEVTAVYEAGSYQVPATIAQAVLTVAGALWKGEEPPQSAYDGLAPYRRQNA
ncbi:MAG: hypothetical protein PHF83_02530 [Candidatus Methanomethylophilus sp.]|nr:hypothetical protein [Methanomethylophilus sp.]